MPALIARRVVLALAIFVTASSLISCEETRPASPEARQRFESVIPKPVSVQLVGNAFVIDASTKVSISEAGKGLENVASFLAGKLSPAPGFDLTVETIANPCYGSISRARVSDAELGDEGYELAVADYRFKIVANTAKGAFFGVQTLRQLLPEKIEQVGATEGPWEIATGT